MISTWQNTRAIIGCMDDSRQTLELPNNPARVLAFIRGFHKMHERPPGAADITTALGLSAKLTRYYLLFLERGGYIRCQRGLARGIVLTALGVGVCIPAESPATHRPAPPEPDGKVRRLVESVFPYGSGELCDICGRHPRSDAERFCPVCGQWLANYVRSRPKGSAATVSLDVARCLALMLRGGERPDTQA